MITDYLQHTTDNRLLTLVTDYWQQTNGDKITDKQTIDKDNRHPDMKKQTIDNTDYWQQTIDNRKFILITDHW